MPEETKIKVLMIGTSRNTRGGITTVVNDYLNSSLANVFNIKYLATHCDGNKMQKFAIAIMAYIKFIFLVLFFQPQIIHIHASSRASFFRKSPFIIFSHLLNKSIVYHQHGSEFMTFFREESNPIQQKFINWILKKATVILALSKQWEKNLKTIDSSLPIQVLPNAIFLPEFPNNTRNHTIKNILFMGRIGKRKGVHDLLVAIENLSQRTSNFRVILGGDGDIAESQIACQKKGIRNFVEFPGWVSGKEKATLYEHADIYVLPSYDEGLPMSVLEAIAYGLPVISTPVGGIPEAVINDHNGFLIKPGDVTALSDKLYQLVNNDALRLTMSKSSRKLAEDNFNLTVIIQSVVTIYHELVNAGKKVK